MKFLSDPNPDVHNATRVALDKFMNEIKKIARLKRGIAESKRGQAEDDNGKRAESTNRSDVSAGSPGSPIASDKASLLSPREEQSGDEDASRDGDGVSSTAGGDTTSADDGEEDYIPGQDVQVDHSKILEILVTFLAGAGEYFIPIPTTTHSYSNYTTLLMLSKTKRSSSHHYGGSTASLRSHLRRSFPSYQNSCHKFYLLYQMV